MEKAYKVHVFHIEYDYYHNDIPADLPTEMFITVKGDKNDDEWFPDEVAETVENATGYDVLHIEYIVLD